MNALEAYRQQHNLTFDELAEKAGRKKPSVWRHCNAGRIPAEAVLGYEAALGIPRGDLRPDMWPSAAPPPPPCSLRPGAPAQEPQRER